MIIDLFRGRMIGMSRTSLLVCLVLVLVCVVMMPGFADKADLSTIREQNEIYVVTDMEDMVAVTSTLSQYACFPLPSWGEDSRAQAYFTIFSYDDGEVSNTQPSLLISVYTDHPWNINSVTIPVDGKDFTFSWQPRFEDYSVTESGYCQNIQIMFGQENIAFIEAMNEKCTSVTDPNLLFSMPVEIVFHGDEDCAATMSEYMMMDYTIVVYAGYCVALDGLNQYIDADPGTAMTMGNSDSVQEAETGKPKAETAASEANYQPLMLQDLVGVWEFESASFLGRSVTAEELAGSTGDNITMEFTSDGLWFQQIGGQNMIAELVVRDDGVVEAPENQSFKLENGKFLFTVNGMTMIFTRSDLPGLDSSAVVDEAKLGTWYFEQVVYTGGDFPGDIPLGADMFPTVYGIPVPTLQVRKTGLVAMKLGDETISFTAEEWQLEDGKLTHTEISDDGTSMIWFFVRETNTDNNAGLGED